MQEFQIPFKRDELLSVTSSSYVVNELFAVSELQKLTSKCQRTLSTDGYFSIFTNFDIVFSVIHQFQKVPLPIRDDAWKILFRTIKQSCVSVNNILETMITETKIDRTALNKHRNAVKMMIFLIVQFIEVVETAFEAIERNEAENRAGVKRGKKSAIQGAVFLDLDWFTELYAMLVTMEGLFKLPLNKLWDPPVIENSIPNTVNNALCKILDRKTTASNHELRQGIAKMYSCLAKRYGLAMSINIELSNLLRSHAHMVPAVISIVEYFLQDPEMQVNVRELLKEICSVQSSDKDITAGNVSNFLQDLAINHPEIAVSTLPLLKNFLDTDPYQLRISALVVMGEVLKGFNGREQLDEREKLQRDRLMNLLLEHIWDVNSFVRSKSMQIWNNIVIGGGLPISRQCELTKLIVGENGALHDTSSIARKFALKTLSSMVLQNPASKISYEELDSILKIEEERLEAFENIAATGRALQQVELENRIGEEVSKSIQDVEEEMECSDEYLSEEEEADTKKDTQRTRKRNHEYEQEAQGLIEATNALKNAAERAATLGTRNSNKISASKDVLKSDEIADGVLNHLAELDIATDKIQSDFQRQLACVAYLRQSRGFAQLLKQGIIDARGFLFSKVQSDVLEAIEFFVIAKESGIHGINDSLIAMLSLIWSGDEPTRKAVIEACSKLYLHPPNESELNTHELYEHTFGNMISLVQHSSIGELASLDKILHHQADSNQIKPGLINFIWQAFERQMKLLMERLLTHKGSKPALMSQKSSQELIRYLNCTLILLGMLEKPSEDRLMSKLDMLINIGLGAEFSSAESKVPPLDFELCKYVCKLIRKLIPVHKKVVGESSEQKPFNPEKEYFRLPLNHKIFTWLRNILVSNILKDNRSRWIPLAEQYVAIIYELCQSPEHCASEFIIQLARTLDKINRASSVEEDNAPTQFITQENNEEADLSNIIVPESFSQIPSYQLARFIYVIGHIGLKQMVYLETDVLKYLKRRTQAKAVNNEKQPASITKPTKASRKSNIRASEGLLNTTSKENLAEEMGLVGAVADDTETDLINMICEEEMLGEGQSLFFKLVGLIEKLCELYKDGQACPHLQAASSLALAKLMLVSSNTCEKNLCLLFTIAEKSTSVAVRANLIIALGDLCRRFPNMMEPWTQNLYARLRDQASEVRINALNTLSHLILNDMVKVKGQISEMTICIVDDHPRLAQLSRIFFRELGQKGNQLYNVLPDIISRLSDSEVGVDEENFRKIIDFLFEQVQKDRLCESLVDKICGRFRTSKSERQWCDIAYCLRSMSAYNDRMLRSLMDHADAYLDKLHVEGVYSCFITILQKVRNADRPEIKTQLEEFEAKLQQVHQRGVQDEEALRRAEIATKEAAAKASKGRGRNRKSHSQCESSGTFRESSPTLGESPSSTSTQLRPSRRNRNQNKPSLLETSLDQLPEEDENIEEKAVDEPNSVETSPDEEEKENRKIRNKRHKVPDKRSVPSRSTQSRKPRRILTFDSEEEET